MPTEPRTESDRIPDALISCKVLDRRIRTALRLLEHDPIYSVCELAREVRLSRTRLQRLFKRDMGMLLGDYLVEQRLRRAAELLVSSSLSIKQVAFAVGYEHHSSFTRAFEKRFSRSPKQYRDQSDITEC